MLPKTALLAQAAMIFVVTLCASYEDEWKRAKLSDDQLETARKILAAWKEDHSGADQRRDGLKDIVNGVKQDTTCHAKYSEVKWQDKKDGFRFKPLCKAFFQNAVLDPATNKYVIRGEFWTCSCSFVGPRLVLLAAHCLVDTTPEAHNIVYVVPQYGIMGEDEKAHFDHFKDNAQIAVEWWLPNEYPGAQDESKNINTIPLDVGFIKTDERMPAQTSFYEMMQPVVNIEKNDKNSYTITLKKELLILGYPFEFKAAEMAVDTEGEIIVSLNMEKKNFRSTLILKSKVTRGNIIQKLLSKGAKSGMQEGGSGGPWILSTAEVNKMKGKEPGLFKKLQMGVFSVLKGGSPDSLNTHGPVFTARLIEASKLIASFDKPEAGQLVSASGHVQVIKFELKAKNENMSYIRS